jgi:hypothetical protein
VGIVYVLRRSREPSQSSLDLQIKQLRVHGAIIGKGVGRFLSLYFL